ncbi:hypothetical protein PIB30_082524 [Stylosanthes scabra]|uniref:Uncharacterized protein n=1 Tax=Stylosanthes scabra TaxID=79078 RepID=A0ABU6VU13_9FABA|nr:hypothetical protein [Stylosanthes scabra]
MRHEVCHGQRNPLCFQRFTPSPKSHFLLSNLLFSSLVAQLSPLQTPSLSNPKTCIPNNTTNPTHVLHFIITITHFHCFILINNLAFTPQAALTLTTSKRFRFNTPHKADIVLAFFKIHGFSNSQIATIVTKLPPILASNPQRILPKFQFLASKGASTHDIVLLVTRHPRFLHLSLENRIIPTYGLLKTLFQSVEKLLSCIVSCPASLMDSRLPKNIKLLADAGVSDSAIGHLCRTRMSVLMSADLGKPVDEVKKLGSDPSLVKFAIALQAIKTIPKSLWDAKVDVLKRWG